MIQRGLQYLTIEMQCGVGVVEQFERGLGGDGALSQQDRKSTRLNSSHLVISYAVFCLKKKKVYIVKSRDSGERQPAVSLWIAALIPISLSCCASVASTLWLYMSTAPLSPLGVVISPSPRRQIHVTT